ncbi:carboxymuconolactone decarboxylase family protein [Citrobacter amalonaticus]|uniref:Carboxymuconolactone decarboxylase family protein n=1 Tax=Citrobacter amalonaticus TaxID=35703 RepID=A0A2S4RYR9_CITAM|nr:carboxymuconolactone decarboxylase family protein [Citrobacter amalonaticus]POT57623.1 carboxymuconolactone decarboxylase family protein [Citrobacter amalonaticus]POT76850.1 carboxymuconolactone decarboxylase family protein [Citrobacter amalonaticus]POU65929.1 carboxymuconolactone decarboxylase family protein [Citrobacter amalonaticus]POV06086.1 carboxymuconolactone decarboxylase family protein [Citrobacter amalonaticus]
MNDPQPWVSPLSRIPLSLKPLIATQKKHYGDVLHPTRWWGRMPFLFWLVALFVGFLERRRARLTPVMRALLMTRVSQVCHCAFCVDANSLRLAQRCGAMDKVLEVATWQESVLFNEEERVALAYAEAVTATPPCVDDALKARMKHFFTDDTIAEMTALLAFQNLSARFNAALDIPAQGLCDRVQGGPRA